MTKKAEKYQFIKAIFVLIGTTIGAGILAIPYSIYHAGYWVGILYLIILGLMTTFLNLMLGEIVLRTKKNLQIPEIIKLYLGKKGYIVSLLAMFIIIYGAMTAYIQAAGEIMNILIPANSLSWSIVFFVISTYFIIKGLKFISKWEVLFVVSMFLIVSTLWMKSIYMESIDWYQFRLNPITSFSEIIQPYGIILFSYFGVIAIPHMKIILSRKNYNQMQAAIHISNSIIILVYSIFVSLVIGVAGTQIEPLSIITLGNKLGSQTLIIISIFALFAMISTFISMGLSMIKSYIYFGKMKSSIAIILTTFPPMAFLLFDLVKFNIIIQYAGGIGVSIIAILIILTFWKAKSEGEVLPAYSLGHLKWVGIVMIIIFSFGALSLFL